MLCVFRGFILIDYLEKAQTTISAYYCVFLSKLRDQKIRRQDYQKHPLLLTTMYQMLIYFKMWPRNQSDVGKFSPFTLFSRSLLKRLFFSIPSSKKLLRDWSLGNLNAGQVMRIKTRVGNSSSKLPDNVNGETWNLDRCNVHKPLISAIENESVTRLLLVRAYNH
ncbi:hypothetical protein TNCV_1003151 [Trichonephila clavipes]|nr:hypothetical protein TNCV_1003151 [Trichonephila clavipes]